MPFSYFNKNKKQFNSNNVSKIQLQLPICIFLYTKEDLKKTSFVFNKQFKNQLSWLAED